MRFTLFILICCIIASLCSCSKSYEIQPEQQLHKYQAYIDHYSKDTTKMGVRTLTYQRTLPQDKCGGMDTIPQQWFLNCSTDSIEHWYYKVDDVGYMTKLQPSRIDTIWVNYIR